MTLAKQLREQQTSELTKLVDWFGSQKMMAHKLGVSKQTAHNWVKRGRISATYAIKAELATDGAIKKQALRPDVIEWEK